ncbi:MAG: cob(I)yrinic acid a,c-diamide adenosyltransferase [Chthoniobacterales bacterium]|nr:cob(I)yrinic acid a,c-diamide adenosyltransferase [Chthoniobacterales bacterium]
MKIYTRTGDNGDTSLFSGERVPKNHPLLSAYGTIDECNSMLSAAIALTSHSEIIHLGQFLQNLFFKLGADLATTENSSRNVQRITTEDVANIESKLDEIQSILPPLRTFILPGGTPAAAFLHTARTIARRAERETIEAKKITPINQQALVLLNRISDLLFLMARYENFLAKKPEIPWEPK